MNTTAFGPPGWRFMFFVAFGYDLNETPKNIKNIHYKKFFKSIGNVLCCKYCRASYSIFYDKLNINDYFLLPEYGLVKFVYDLKELVNNKLRKQERKALKKEYIKLKNKNMPDSKLWDMLREKSQKICYTKPTPTFESVVEDLKMYKAGCSSGMKTCRKPLK